MASGECGRTATAGRKAAETVETGLPRRGIPREGTTTSTGSGTRSRAAQARGDPCWAAEARKLEDRIGATCGSGAGPCGWQNPPPSPARPGPSRNRSQKAGARTRSTGEAAGSTLPAATPAASEPTRAAMGKTRAGTDRPGTQPSRSRRLARGSRRRRWAAARNQRGRGAGAGSGPAQGRQALRRRARRRATAQQGGNEAKAAATTAPTGRDPHRKQRRPAGPQGRRRGPPPSFPTDSPHIVAGQKLSSAISDEVVMTPGGPPGGSPRPE